MTREEYAAYLHSQEWRARAEETKRIAGYRCVLCASNGPLEVHHRTYERIGRELTQDLTCLCETCHREFHAGSVYPRRPQYDEDRKRDSFIGSSRLPRSRKALGDLLERDDVTEARKLSATNFYLESLKLLTPKSPIDMDKIDRRCAEAIESERESCG